MNPRLLVPITFLLLLLLPGCAEEAPGRLAGTAIFDGQHAIAAGERVPGALLLAQGTLRIEAGGSLAGPLYMLSGALDVDGEIAGDLNVLGGEVALGPDARVTGDLNHGGGSVAVDPATTIGGELVAGTAGMSLPGLEAPERSPAEEVARFLLEPLLLALFGFFLTRTFPRPVERVAAAAVEQPVVAGAFGLLVLIVIPALLIMVAFTMILLPVALLGLVSGFFVAGYGWIAIGSRLGRWLGQRLRPLPAPWATFLGTLLLLYLIQASEWIPYVGFAVFALALAVSVGAVLLTRFGRRRYVPRPVDLPPADTGW